MYIEWGEKTRNLVGSWDIFSRDSRVIPIFNAIISSQNVTSTQSMPSVAEQVYGDLILLGQKSKDPVKIVINSPGGSVLAGFTIIQAMSHLKAKGIEVWTLNLCQSMSMGGVILAMGTQGRRYTIDNSLVHAHSGDQVIRGRTDDVESITEFNKHVTETLVNLLCENTKIAEYYIRKEGLEDDIDVSSLSHDKRVKFTKKFLGTERMLKPEDAVEAGMADKVLSPGDQLIDEIFKIEISSDDTIKKEVANA
jgi:ATP-dependent Clp protease, protease subunit